MKSFLFSVMVLGFSFALIHLRDHEELEASKAFLALAATMTAYYAGFFDGRS